MMKLKDNFIKANKKQLRKLIKKLIIYHNNQETQWDEQLKMSQERIEGLKQRLIYQGEKYDDLEKELEIRTSHTSDLLSNAYS